MRVPTPSFLCLSLTRFFSGFYRLLAEDALRPNIVELHLRLKLDFKNLLSLRSSFLGGNLRKLDLGVLWEDFFDLEDVKTLFNRADFPYLDSLKIEQRCLWLSGSEEDSTSEEEEDSTSEEEEEEEDESDLVRRLREAGHSGLIGFI
jgi:hypothetical protein